MGGRRSWVGFRAGDGRGRSSGGGGTDSTWRYRQRQKIDDVLVAWHSFFVFVVLRRIDR